MSKMVDIGSAKHIPCIFSSVPSGQLHWNDPARFSYTCVMLQISWLLIKASTHSSMSIQSDYDYTISLSRVAKCASSNTTGNFQSASCVDAPVDTD